MISLSRHEEIGETSHVIISVPYILHILIINRTIAAKRERRNGIRYSTLQKKRYLQTIASHVQSEVGHHEAPFALTLPISAQRILSCVRLPLLVCPNVQHPQVSSSTPLSPRRQLVSRLNVVGLGASYPSRTAIQEQYQYQHLAWWALPCIGFALLLLRKAGLRSQLVGKANLGMESNSKRSSI